MVVTKYTRSNSLVKEEVRPVKNESRRDSIKVMRNRYQGSGRKDRSFLLNEVTTCLDVHRKHAIRLMNGGREPKRRGGRPRLYTEAMALHLKVLWRQLGLVNSRTLVAALPTWLPHYRAEGFTEAIRGELLRVSASTVDRILRPVRAGMRRRNNTGTRPGYLKQRIPLKNFDYNRKDPGVMEGDTVAHCGDQMNGTFIWSLTATDIVSGWTENEAMWGRYAEGVVEAMQSIEDRLPFILNEFQTDNGNEFLNDRLISHCHRDQRERAKRKTSILMSRGRPYKKNDQCHVEQKNWTHVRQLFGYERFDQKELVSLMNDVYRNSWRHLQNFFTPQMKITSKLRVGSKIKKFYSVPKTPYQRLLESEAMTDDQKNALRLIYDSLDPFQLRAQLSESMKIFQKELRRAQYSTKCAHPASSIDTDKDAA